MFPREQPAFGQALAEWRKAQKMSQTELAERLKAVSRTYQRWESGESMPRRSVVVELDAMADGQGPDRLERIEQKLDEVLEILRDKRKK